MILNLIFFFIFSLIITFSTIGYGFALVRVLKIDYFNLNYGFVGILGLFFLSIIASFTHLFLAHGYIHNLIIILFGLFFLIISKQKNFKQFIRLSIIFSFLFICILVAKNNEDFGYYHLPNSIQFVEQKLQFGLGNINHGFKHISSIFQLMSLNYLPIFHYYLFNITNFLFFLFFITFAIFQLFDNKRLTSNISNIFLILFLILFIAKFSRLAEYGSDISGQIIITIFLYYIVEIILNKKLSEKYLKHYFNISLILIVFAVSLKFILVIYSVLFFSVFLIIFKKKLFFKIFNLKILFISFLAFGIFIFFNFSSTGCLIYPVEKLCFTKTFDWALDSKTVNYLNFHYELWAKGGRGPNFSVENPIEYVQSFNWVSNWISKYFIGKFTDFILVTFIILFVFSLVFVQNFLNYKISFKKFTVNSIIIYLNFLAIFTIWFLNFPTLRYAGFVIVFILIAFPFILLFDEVIDLSLKVNFKKIIILILISYSIFLIKNIQRINNEFKLSTEDHHNFKNFPFFWVNNVNSTEHLINGHLVFKVNGMCWNTKSTCVRNLDNLRIVEKNKYIFYSIN